MGCGNSTTQAQAKQVAGGFDPAQQAPAGGFEPSLLSSPETGKQTPPVQPNQVGIQMMPDGKTRIVMRNYRMNTDKESEMGQGAFSICYKGTIAATGEAVAIKVYKEASKKNMDVMMLKFKRQIEVLLELQEPFAKVVDKTLWHEALKAAKPVNLFMTLLDWSKDADGPSTDPDDGLVYVVTELAQYSLKDYLALRREQHRPIPKESVQSISRAIILVVAGLHAKSLVHIDLKPENLMMFNGRLKLIDVDGCVKMGTTVSIQDSSISFSPCYCAPEWAEFLTEESSSTINIQPSLDVWSVGMSLCELVTLNALLKPMYGNFLRNAHSHREAGFLFMDWLSTIKKCPVPKLLERSDKGFKTLILDWLLVPDKNKRKTCAQCLANPYIMGASKKLQSAPEIITGPSEEMIKHLSRARPTDDSKAAPLYKGTLWKLNSGADPKEPKNWLKRDMWLTQQGSLCYFSTKDNKRLVLVDGAKLGEAEIVEFSGCMLVDGPKPAFSVNYAGDQEDTFERIVLAVGSQEEYNMWTDKLKGSCRMDIPTMHLGNHVAELRKFVVNVKNRRQKVVCKTLSAEQQFAPVWKAKLWKLKADGDKMNSADWFEREMWIAENGSLVYYSQKEERDLVYYTAADVMRASYSIVADEESCKPFTFLVHLPEADGVEFAPGEFAANSEDEQGQWIQEFQAGKTRSSKKLVVSKS